MNFIFQNHPLFFFILNLRKFLSYILLPFLVFILMGLPSLQADDLPLGNVKNVLVIDDILFTGLKKVEPEALLEKIKFKIGSTITNYELRDAIKQIYGMKYFENVEARLLKKNGKNILKFNLEEKPIIGLIEFEGNDELSEDDLKNQLKTKQYSILDINTIKADVNIIENFYEEKGYYLATASYRLEDNEYGGKNLVFKIKEFDKVRVKKILFIGNDSLQDQEIKGVMATREESLFSFFSGSGNFKEFNFQTDIERIKYLYKSRGHLQINVANPIVTVSEDKRWIFITVKLKEGPKFSINNIYFDGDLLFTEAEMRDKMRLSEGDEYSEEKLRLDIQDLTEMYQDKGYAFANVLRNLQLVPGENKVDIHFSFEKGKIAYFGKITVKGNSKTRDKVVRRELRVYEGMKYSGSKLRASKENVNRLGFFENNTVIFNTVSRKDQDNILDLEISVKERQTGQITVGAGYSTANNAFLQASIAQINFRGLGQNLQFSLSYAENQQRYNLGFTEPYLFDSLWTAGFDIFKNVNRTIKSFASETHGVALRVGYPIFEYTRAFVTLKHEEQRVSEVRDPNLDKNEESGVTASVRGSIVHDRRNNVFEPTKGHFVSTSVEEAAFYGDQKWVRANLEGRVYQPLYEDLIFRSRLRVSQMWQSTSRPIPRNEKFSLGGPRNMRGYSIEAIGPKKRGVDRLSGGERDFNQRGLYSVLGTLELEHPLIAEAGLKWVVFYDAGNIFEEHFGEDDNYWLRQDYGFGFRWFSPIGILRFEFGYPIDKDEDDKSNQFHFDIGSYF
ncbi:outer membrane protein assembly factor BamA [Bacteriovoracaceae bacterium]|nr:outer membrane protein assembly factor BamA [Bacteriovoracaceae bacterium]